MIKQTKSGQYQATIRGKPLGAPTTKIKAQRDLDMRVRDRETAQAREDKTVPARKK